MAQILLSVISVKLFFLCYIVWEAGFYQDVFSVVLLATRAKNDQKASKATRKWSLNQPTMKEFTTSTYDKSYKISLKKL